MYDSFAAYSMAAMRGAVMVALAFLVACRGEVKFSHDDARISHDDGKISIVSQSLSGGPRFDRPTRYFYKIEFTMPKDFPIDHDDPFVTMTDTSGRRFEAKETTISTTGDGVKMVEGISAEFEVPEDSKPGVIQIGDYYDVDVSSRRITRRASSSAAP
jgi:hypothetical protein